MHSILFTAGPVTVYMYGLMLALGAFTGIGLAMYRAKRRGLDPDAVFGIGLYGVLVGIAGAKVMYALVHIKEVLAQPSILWSGDGFLIYGGIGAAFLFVWFYCKKKNISFVTYFDHCLPSVPLAQGIGRLGCFFAGCCYGKPTDSFLGIVFPEGGLAPAGIPLWPTQLVSAAWNVLLGLFLIWISKRKNSRGLVFFWYILFFGLGRFIIDFFRDDGQNVIGAVSVSQVISLVLAVLGAAALLFAWYRRKKHPAEAPAEEAAEDLEEEET